MSKSVTLVLIGLVVLMVGGYFTYEYVKRTPPDFMVKLFTATAPPPALPSGNEAPFLVPEGFTATIFARDIEDARVMTVDPKGTLLVSQTGAGKVVALPDFDANGEADETVVLMEGLRQPHGILIRCPDVGGESASADSCTLYIAETDAVKSYRYDPDTFTAEYEKTLITLPSGRGHFTRTLLMHPDGRRLLVSVGSSCNVCEEEDALRASVVAIDLQTGESAVFANGLRNTVFMAVRPDTEDIWGTDNGRDLIGDDIPPDEINILREGRDYGWPICYGNRVHDTDFDKRQYFVDPCANTEPPHIEFPAHSAALGLAFVPDEWPEDMRGDVLVAFHGSWNRSTPTGYKIVRISLDEDGKAAAKPQDFMTGFLPDGSTDTDDALGRPVGLLMKEGQLFVSDDRAGAIYLVTPAR